MAATVDATPEAIAAAVGSPLPNVQRFWPAIRDALKERGMGDPACVVAALATVATEVDTFAPVAEHGTDAELEARYHGKLGNVHPGDGARYRGRGFVQLSGRLNYHNYGRMLGVDLESDPDQALQPGTAARLLAAYFQDHGVCKLARAGEWQAVRKAVNGGLNGWPKFSALVAKLQAL